MLTPKIQYLARFMFETPFVKEGKKMGSMEVNVRSVWFSPVLVHTSLQSLGPAQEANDCQDCWSFPFCTQAYPYHFQGGGTVTALVRYDYVSLTMLLGRLSCRQSRPHVISSRVAQRPCRRNCLLRAPTPRPFRLCFRAPSCFVSSSSHGRTTHD